MKTAVLTVLLSLIHFGSAFVVPSVKSRVTTITQLPASLAEDDGMSDLDEEWMQFQEEQTTKQISLKDFAKDTSETAAAVQDDTGTDAIAAGVCLSVAVACLVAVYYSGEAPEDSCSSEATATHVNVVCTIISWIVSSFACIYNCYSKLQRN